MFGSYQVSVKIEEILDSSMSSKKPLSLPYRFESPHPSLPHPSRFMGLLSPIIGVLISDMNHLWYHFSMGHRIATQLICHDLPGLCPVTSQ